MGVFGGVLAGFGEEGRSLAKAKEARRQEDIKTKQQDTVNWLAMRQQSLNEAKQALAERMATVGKVVPNSITLSKDGKTAYAFVNIPGKGITVQSWAVPEGIFGQFNTPEAAFESELKAWKDTHNGQNMPDAMQEKAFAASYGIPYSKAAISWKNEQDKDGVWRWHGYDAAGDLVATSEGPAPTPSTAPKTVSTDKVTDPFSGAEKGTVTTTYGGAPPAAGVPYRNAAPYNPTAKGAGKGVQAPPRKGAAPTPASREANAKKFATNNPDALKARLGWTNDPKLNIPSPALGYAPPKYWRMIDDAADQLLAGNDKALPPQSSKNFILRSVISMRARELGWTGEKTTTQELEAGKWARAALSHLPAAEALITRLDQEGKLGPLAGRYNEFMAGAVGAGDPEYAELRGYMTLLTTALVKQHVGSRGGQSYLEHFQSLWQPGRMDAPTLNAGLKVMQSFMQTYAKLGFALRDEVTPEEFKATTGIDIGTGMSKEGGFDPRSAVQKALSAAGVAH